MSSRLCMKQYSKGTHCFKAFVICVLLGYDLKFISYCEVQDTVRKLLPTSTLRGTSGVWEGKAQENTGLSHPNNKDSGIHTQQSSNPAGRRQVLWPEQLEGWNKDEEAGTTPRTHL